MGELLAKSQHWHVTGQGSDTCAADSQGGLRAASRAAPTLGPQSPDLDEGGCRFYMWLVAGSRATAPRDRPHSHWPWTPRTRLSSHTPRSPLGWRLSVQPAELHTPFQSVFLGGLWVQTSEVTLSKVPTWRHSRTFGKSDVTASDSESKDTGGSQSWCKPGERSPAERVGARGWGKGTARRGVLLPGSRPVTGGDPDVWDWESASRLQPTLSHSRPAMAGRPAAWPL